MDLSLHVRLIDVIRRRPFSLRDAGRFLPLLSLFLEATPASLLGSEALVNDIDLYVPKAGAGASLETLLDRPLADWPPFELQLAQRHVNEPTTGRTMSPSPVKAGHNSEAARLASFILEVLGGTRRNAAGAPLFSPLPGIGAEANELLRAAFNGKIAADCTTFLAQWLSVALGDAAVPPAVTPQPPVVDDEAKTVPRPAPGPTTPPPPARRETGTILELRPLGVAAVPSYLSARPEFRIGRSRSSTDFPLRYETLDHGTPQSITKVSRIHVLAQAGAAVVTLRDGDGTKPSGNGSAFDGTPLDVSQPTVLDRQGVLLLGGSCGVELVPVVREGSLHAVVLLPLDGVRVVRNAAWIFSRIFFRVRATGEFVWQAGESAATGSIAYHDQRFMMRAASSDDRISLDDVPISPGETTTLGHDQTLRVNDYSFALHVL